LDFRTDYVNFAPSCYYAFGCSYSYNNQPFNPKHLVEGLLPGQVREWVRQPSRYILCYEQPARPLGKIIGDICTARAVDFLYYFHWHFNNGKSTVTDLDSDGQKFISPILFVDGHAATYDFTQTLKTNPGFPTEEAKDWIWYQPLPDGTNRMEVNFR
jgi:prepilin-type processing-associated H-X9-DG protein